MQGPTGAGNDIQSSVDGSGGLDGPSADVSSDDSSAGAADLGPDSDVSPDGDLSPDSDVSLASDSTSSGCGAGCPPGYVCYGEGANGQCVPGADFACTPCVSSATCLGGLCVDFPDGKGCLIPCLGAEQTSSCPNGFSCDTGLCQPISGSCTCGPGNGGEKRPCSVGNGGQGICGGVQSCVAASGWSLCTAKAASAETCDGLDDDCDGLTDEDQGGSTCGTGICAGKVICSGGLESCAALATAATEACNGLDDDCDGLTDDEVGAGLPCEIANGAGSCAGVVVCAGTKGASCDAKTPAIESCNGLDDDCNGAIDDGWIDSGGLYSTPDACGSCANPCVKPTGSHGMATCTGSQCGLACEMGWIDLDANLGNGCECWFVSDLDEPDGVDQNCDGIDGDISQAVFVAKTGADGNPGTLQLPVASVQKALSIAEMQGKRDVYVAGGVYTGSLDLTPGVSMYGGYSPNFGQRDTVSHQTAIVGIAPNLGPSAALRCTGIAGSGQKTRVDGFTVFSANAKEPGQSSFGLLSIGCDERLQVTYNHVGAGDGAAGLAGLPGSNGGKGVAGAVGVKAKDIGHESCGKSDASAGGSGGSQVCGGQDASGGKGGATVCPAFDEDSPAPKCPTFPYAQSTQVIEIGEKGAGAGGGPGGVAGADAYIDSYKGKVTSCLSDKTGCNTCHVPVKQLEGDDGGMGAGGTLGTAGVGCKALQGQVIGGVWQPVPGGLGGFGLAGGGGGGGGAAGAIEVHDCTTTSAAYSDLGGSGGGGGAGGCGGTGGTGGGSGGGSFAVFVSTAKPGDSLPILFGNTLTSGAGGSGGTGGPAGSGGPGGQGGKGGASGEDQTITFCTSKGGTGGAGGHGGHGGGGGGGCGGPSVLLAVAGAQAGDALIVQKQNQTKALGQGGKGGSGGPSIGNIGLAGQNGMAGFVLEF